MDVLELLAAESAADALVAGCLDVTVAREIISDIVANELLKEYVVQLTVHRYNPGEPGLSGTVHVITGRCIT